MWFHKRLLEVAQALKLFNQANNRGEVVTVVRLGAM